MTTANDLIAALNQRRLLKAGRVDDVNRMPPGWQRWFDGLERVDAVSMQARPASWVDVFLQRPLRQVPRSPAAKGRLAAFISLLQQEWQPDDRDDRGLRIGAGAIDVLMHLLLAALLLWLMYLAFVNLQQAPQEDEAVQVEFIGRGNVEEGGGALAAEGAESAPASAAPSSQPAPTPAPAATAEPAPAPSSAMPRAAVTSIDMSKPPPMPVTTDVPELVRDVTPPVPPQAAQPLQVTEVPRVEPDSFQLPPPQERAVPIREPQLREPQPVQQVESIATLRTQPVRTLQPTERDVELKVPELRQQAQAIEVFRPDPSQLARERAVPESSRQQAQVQVPQFRGQVRDIPLKAGGAPNPASQPGSGTASNATASNTGAGGERGNAPAAGQSQAGTREGNRPSNESGRGITNAGSGAGAANRPAPGGWQGAAKSDDWGAAARNAAGTGVGKGKDGSGKPGLFDADGSARLPDEWSKQDSVNIDREGSWLKRPGLEYRGTRFDNIWIPGGTLLEEWVRRGIKKIAIPIPGSSARLECVVSLLQLGGGCFPVNPDVNEQPATGRPAPDVPFVPELQEDNGSQRPQGGGG